MSAGALNIDSIFDKLEVKIPEVILIEPYGKIPEADWHKIPNDRGGFDPVPLGWRNIGVKVRYPDVRINNGIGQAATKPVLVKVEGARGKRQIERFSQPSVIRYYIDNVICGMYLVDSGQEVEWTQKTKDRLYASFMACPFLWNAFADDYDAIRGEAEENEKREEQNFTTPSTTMPAPTTQSTEVRNGEKPSKGEGDMTGSV